jgi:hypothetical protein
MKRYLVIWCPDLLEQKEHGREKRGFARVTEAVSALTTHIETVRPGVCAVPTRGPSRYFGGDLALCRKVQQVVSQAVPGISTGVGVADGLFAAVLAAKSAVSGPDRGAGPSPESSDPCGYSALVVPEGGTPSFLGPWPVEVLERFELADLLVRLGIRTLGQFSALPARHVLARFGADGAACHLAASGLTGELPGQRVGARDTEIPSGSGSASGVSQKGFWGGTAEADVAAGNALARMQDLLGPEEVMFGRIQGGRGPSERSRLVPVDPSRIGSGHDRSARPDGQDEPWPGRLPAPSPAVVLANPAPVDVLDRAGRPVVVSSRILLSAPPARVSICKEPWSEVVAWAGPWPSEDRWWSPDHRRRARMQLVTAPGVAQLLVAVGRAWWLEGTYD